MSEEAMFPLSFIPTGIESGVLERTLVGRRELVDKLEQLVIESTTTGNKHQRLIIGPRGSGKTHTLRVLFNRVSNMEELKDKLRIAYLIEEEYGVASFLDLTIRVLYAFIRWDGLDAAYLNDEIEKLKKTPSADREKVAVNILLEYIKGKTLLVIVENIETIFDKKQGFGTTGQKKFRDLLQQHPYFTIMASNQSLFLDVQREDRPFHNFFKIEYLRRLTLAETFSFLKLIAVEDGNDGLTEFLGSPQGKGRIRAIYELIGGNHRLLVIFYRFLKTDYVSKLSGPFMKTVDALIPFYQGMMNLLTAQQQKVIQYMCKLSRPATGKEIADNCFIDANTLSKQLFTLVRLKYVDSHPRGRKTFYELAEPLLRICFEVKENKGSPVKLFVDFIGNFYTSEEIKRKFMRYHVLSKTTPSIDSPQNTGTPAFDENLWLQRLLSHIPQKIDIKTVDFSSLLLGDDAAFENNPGGSASLVKFGSICIINKLYQEASFIFTRVIEKDSKFLPAYIGLACLKYIEDLPADGLGKLKQGFMLSSKDEFDKEFSQDFMVYVSKILNFSSKETVRSFLTDALPLFFENGDSSIVITCVILATWALLHKFRDIEVERFDFINEALIDAFSGNDDTMVLRTLFDVGIRYLKKGEKNALFSLSKEVREFFQENVLDYIEGISKKKK